MSLTIPDNIEELISAYLVSQAIRLVEAGGEPEAHVYVTKEYGAYKTTALSCGPSQEYHLGDTVAEAIEKHLEQLRTYDPLAEKKQQFAALQAEIEAMEGGSDE